MLLCVCFVSNIISLNCTIRYATIPEVSANSVPLFKTLSVLHSPLSPPFLFTIDETSLIEHPWTGRSGIRFGGTLFLCGDLCGMTGNHNSRRCRQLVKPNECDHNVTMQQAMHSLVRMTEAGDSSLITNSIHLTLMTRNMADCGL